MTTVRHWQELSWDPNAPAVVGWRQKALDATHRPPVLNRVEYLRSVAEGRNVLDVGVVEHDATSAGSDRWLHRHMVEAAARCVGVDILPEGVAALQEQGYDVRLRDITSDPLDETFDVVVAGEIVEHLGAPESLFHGVRAMLAPGGRFVLTTPNPYMVHRTWRYLRGAFPDSVDHATLLCASNLVEIADRAGMELVAWRGIRLKDLSGWRNKVTAMGRKTLIRLGFAPEIACDSIIYEFQTVDPAA